MQSAQPLMMKNSFHKNFTFPSQFSFFVIFFILFTAFIFLSSPRNANAACSSYKNRAVVNEAHRQGNTERFVEIKLLDASITNSIYDNWSITICSDARGCTGAISVSAANDSGYPHVVIEKPLISHQNYIDLTVGGGMDVILKDGSGNTIDYFSVSGYTNQQDSTCTPAYDWDFPGSNSQTVLRSPDGTGDWEMAGPGGSVPPTESNPNDTLPDGSTPPRLNITNETVTSGNTAVFTLTLLDPVSSDPVDDYTVSLDYQTVDDTAQAGVDYVATSGTITFPEGSPAGTTATVSVDTTAGCASGSDLYFYLFLNNQVNVTLLNHFAIGTIQLAGSSSLDHFEIQHDGAALTCEPETVTVRACQTADCSILYPCSTDITLSPSGWVGGNDKTFSGSATFQLRHNTLAAPPLPDIVTLGISAYTPIPSSATPVTCLNTTTSAADCNITFYESGFVFDIPTQVACETSAAITISAVRKDLETEQCVPAFDGRTETIDFRATYANPATGTNSLILNTITPPNVYNLTPPAVNPITLDFDANGESTITVNYPDAGQLQLDASFTGSGSEAGLVMTGIDTFVTRPFALFITIPGNPGATDASGAFFTTAGTAFSTDVTAVCWQAADDADNNGIADGHDDTNPTNNANLGDNPAVPNFGQEAAAESVALAGLLNQPAGGNDPGLAGTTTVASFTNGNGSTTVNYSEVGIIEISAGIGDGDYLGIGPAATADIVGSSGYIGRFIPDRFNVTINPTKNNWQASTAYNLGDEVLPTFHNGHLYTALQAGTSGATEPGSWPEDGTTVNDGTVIWIDNQALLLGSFCGPFTYLDQPFSYIGNLQITIEALNSSGNLTQNYGGDGTADDFWKLSAPALDATYYTDQAGIPTSVLSINNAGTVAVNQANDFDGDGILEISSASFNYPRPAAEIWPFNALFDFALPDSDLTDSDGVCYDPDADATCDSFSLINITGTQLRHGIATAMNAYGPETVDAANPLIMNVMVEYYDSTDTWLTNPDDSCTTYDYTIASQNDITVNLPVGPTTITMNAGQGDLTMWPTADPNISPNYPGGFVVFNFDFPSWLEPDPIAEAYFGLFRGNDRIINWQEIVR